MGRRGPKVSMRAIAAVVGVAALLLAAWFWGRPGCTWFPPPGIVAVGGWKCVPNRTSAAALAVVGLVSLVIAARVKR